ncbi:MAG: hypothetical protein IT167_05275 [Bryobacterales bacterium]|nr:hypothetical protein [Bryobacterales bacterium]
MRLLLDPWPADYEAPIAFDAPESQPEVDVTVETGEWSAFPPGEAGRDTACCFVDGVRRVEARVLADLDTGGFTHGLFGSLAAGYVRAAGGKAEFGDIRVARFLVMGNGVLEGREFPLGSSTLSFAPCPAVLNTPEGVLAELQSRMRAAEAALAESMAGEGCVFVDGPSYRATSRFAVVGVIKRILNPYLGEPQFSLLGRLHKGERTPLFAITDKTYNRYSCYLRLSDPRALDHPLAGIVRIEIGAAVGVDAAKSLAGFAAAVLPSFASTAMRDPRAPQNLLPVGALEQEMRRRLGDPLLIRRAIEKELHEQRNR